MTTIANRITKALRSSSEQLTNPVISKAQADVAAMLTGQGFSAQLLDAQAALANAIEREHLLRLQVSLQYLPTVSAQVMNFSGEQIPPGAAKALIAAAEVVQASLQASYQQNLTAAAGRINPKIVELTAVVNAELEKMFDQIETVRWAALEAAVDEDLAAGRFKTFGSASSAVAYLNNQAKKHGAKLSA